MENNIVLQLKRLKTITPDPVWNANARRVVLASREILRAPISSGMRYRFLWFAAPVLALGVIAFVMLPTSFLPAEDGGLAANGALNPQSIAQELKGFSIHVQIKEIRYQETADNAVATALSEITDSATQHLSPSLLKSEEANALNLTNPKNPSIDEMLDTVIF
ncbi:MAG: hypothetical protein AAB631_03135 [Patescibacteria group bacterium]